MSDTFVDDVLSGSSPDAGQQDPTSSQGQPGGEGGEGGEAGEQGGQIPRHRLNEVIQQQRAWEQRATEFYQQNQELQRQILELSRAQQQASQPQPQVDPVTAKVREQILQVFPELKDLFELRDKKDQLLGAANAVPAFEQAQQQHWNQRGAEAMRTLNGAIDETFKGVRLEDSDRRYFQAAFIDYLDTNPQAQQRYLQGDPSLPREFWDTFAKRVLQPFRRGATVEVNRAGQRVARLPRMGQTNTVVPGGQRPAQPKSPDELHDAAWDALQTRLSQ